jgi:WD40 repeat protein
MSPLDDSFISGSLDKTLRLWDLRSHNCQVWLVSSIDSLTNCFVFVIHCFVHQVKVFSVVCYNS